MKGSVVFRWLVPAALGALLAIPVQTAGASPMGGGHGGMGGGHGMGGMGRGGFGGRGMGIRRPAMSSRFFNSNGTNHFANRQNLASRNHDRNLSHDHDRFIDRRDRNLDHRDQFRDSHGLADRHVDRADRFADRGDRFRDNHFGRFDRDDRFGRFDRDDRAFFVNHNFFVGFNFGAFGWWPGWWWGGPWWWGWDGWAYPYPSDYAYGYGDACNNDPPAQSSQYGSKEYWADLATQVQSKLAEQSYYQGAIDGVIGSDTQQAVRKYQADHGLTVTGTIDPKLLDALGIQYKKQSEEQNGTAARS